MVDSGHGDALAAMAVAHSPSGQTERLEWKDTAIVPTLRSIDPHGSELVSFPCRLGPYVLYRLIGQGATAQVFEATRSGRFGISARVALKRLLPHLSDDPEHLNMFIREARVCSQLHHPNILQIQDFNEADGQFYIVTDFVEGCDLETLIYHARTRGQPIPTTVVTDIICQLLQGLAHAHGTRDAIGRNVNLLHRDIKPSNILIGRDGTVKLGDFGIARTDTCRFQTLSNQFIKGTLRYMSPEHVRLEEITQASDLFSVGAVLYEMLTLNPFVEPDANIEQIVRRINFEPRGMLLEALTEEQACFGMVLEMALQAETIRRYGSALEFLDDIHAAQYTLPPGPSLAAFVATMMENETEEEDVEAECSNKLEMMAC